MHKIIPYIVSIILGFLSSIYIFNINFNKYVAFEIGAFKDITLAKEYIDKYPSSILILEDNVYRVYYSILSLDETINHMEEYLKDNNISYYKKDISIKDKGLINALDKYEKDMINVSDITFISINKMIMESYGSKI